MYNYMIYDDCKVVGSAKIMKEGLYYHIQCFCKPKDMKLYEVWICSEDRRISVGVCVPVEDGFFAEKRIPQKEIETVNLRFVLMLRNAQNATYRIECHKHFPGLRNIENARLIKQGHEYDIEIIS